MSAIDNTRAWLEEHFHLNEVLAFLRHKTVPLHRYTPFYFLGGMTLFLFGIQVVTGILLLLYYRPTPNDAFESVQYLMTQVRFGWLVRSIHSWSANLMILTAFAHMFSVFFMRAYRKPRELTWLSGMVLLVLVLCFGFSGYLLPWNTLSFFATKVGTDLPAQVPVVGKWILVFLRGGEDVTGATLTRFFGFHVALLPGLATLFLGLHLLLIQRTGMSVPPGVEAEWRARPAVARDIPFFPNFLLRELMAWYIALGILGALAALKPWELGTKADPFASAPAGIRPEWYFMFMFQTLKVIPAKVLGISGELLGAVGIGVAALIWTLLPFFDRGEPGRKHRLIAGIGVFALAYIVAMTIYGYLAK
ncbi:MAG TPA: cytochrome bc complex cytochrome b subunit [Candidatus Sulfotelmatobacter sp.]|nr:cytochrome bc complex cytochrome b subunit [Candidatus Sulfotelmatobacter sp.]